MNKQTAVAQAKIGDRLAFGQAFGCPRCGKVHVALSAPAGYEAEIACNLMPDYADPATWNKSHVIRLKPFQRADGSGLHWVISDVYNPLPPVGAAASE